MSVVFINVGRLVVIEQSESIIISIAEPPSAKGILIYYNQLKQYPNPFCNQFSVINFWFADVDTFYSVYEWIFWLVPQSILLLILHVIADTAMNIIASTTMNIITGTTMNIITGT